MIGITVTIVGHDGPGTVCVGYSDVEVSVQIDEACVDAAPGDIIRFTARVSVTYVPHPDGARWRGAGVHGPTRDRFLYLVWSGVHLGAPRSRFRRAKIKLGLIPDEVLKMGLASGALVVSLPLTASDGTPVCATVHEARWSVG